MRIGVHSGNLFAGVIGQTKLQYDVWGKLLDLRQTPFINTLLQDWM